MRHLHLVYPHHLFAATNDLPAAAEIVCVEDPLFFRQYRFHTHKLMLHRASMQAFAVDLRERGRCVMYVESRELEQSDEIATILGITPRDKVTVYDPVDDWLEERLRQAVPHLEILPSPGFFLTREEVEELFPASRTRFSMARFYQHMRRRLGVLMEGEKPRGGQWSFDTENRKKLPKDLPLPPKPTPSKNPYVREAAQYVSTHFPNHPGRAEEFYLPVTYREAKTWMERFFRERFALFGPYEDAMAPEEPFVFHSILSPLLNCGLLTPAEVLEAALAHPAPLASQEGFLRQVIGWREYVRGLYQQRGRHLRTQNVLGHHASMPTSFYTGSTGLLPFDTVLRRTLTYGYAHHIERLMVAGNLMLLSRIHPDAVYTWFMELYVDAYDWVMVPNVYGMSQFAAGPCMTTKPYFSGSAYLLRMSSFTKGDWCTVWDGLYWRFVEEHGELLRANPRLSLTVRSLENMTPARRQLLREAVEAWEQNLQKIID